MNKNFVFIDFETFYDSKFNPLKNTIYVLSGDDIVCNSIAISSNINNKKIKNIIENKANAYLDNVSFYYTAYIKNKNEVLYSFCNGTRERENITHLPAPLLFYQYTKQKKSSNGVLFVLKTEDNKYNNPNVCLCYCDEKGILINRNISYSDNENLNTDIGDTISVLNREYNKEDFNIYCIGFEDQNFVDINYNFSNMVTFLDVADIVSNIKMPITSYYFKEKKYFIKLGSFVLSLWFIIYFFVPFAVNFYEYCNLRSEEKSYIKKIETVNMEINSLNTSEINSIFDMKSFNEVQEELLYVLNILRYEPFELKESSYFDKDMTINFAGVLYGLNPDLLKFNLKTIKNKMKSYSFNEDKAIFLNNLNVFKINFNSYKKIKEE
ncbi:MAG: hypothetical protein ACOC1K_03640 [Nanoarchaeota archaeon]